VVKLQLTNVFAFVEVKRFACLVLVVPLLDGSVEDLCLCPVDSLSLHTGQLDNYFDDVIHDCVFLLVLVQSLLPMWLGSLRTHSRALSGRIHGGCTPPLVSRGKPLVRHTCGTYRNLSCCVICLLLRVPTI
jgi:hypothetical protein